ncbi:hypothetical protein JCM10212_005026 [Sporobolomyces blumeae]
MRSFVVALLALGIVSFANAEALPEPEPGHGGKSCGGYSYGWCPGNKICTRTGRTYSCKRPGKPGPTPVWQPPPPPPPPPVVKPPPPPPVVKPPPPPPVVKPPPPPPVVKPPPPPPVVKPPPPPPVVKPPPPPPVVKPPPPPPVIKPPPPPPVIKPPPPPPVIKPPPPPPIVKPPTPSGKLHNTWKRSLSSCTDGKVACPVPGILHGFDCVDISSDLEQCGDCAVMGGVDCTNLPGVSGVACVNGYCKVEGCLEGWTYDFRRRTCVRTSSFWAQQQQQQQ